MYTVRMTAAAVVAIALSVVSAPCWAKAQDYAFELVSAKPVGTGKTDVAVRLLHQPDGKTVSGVEIIEAQNDMGPSGMADMSSKAIMLPNPKEDGGFHFLTATSMAGKWALRLTAKIPGETEALKSTVEYVSGR